MKLRTMLAALVLAGLMTFLYSAQTDLHESVASDGSPAPPLETTPNRIEPSQGSRRDISRQTPYQTTSWRVLSLPTRSSACHCASR